jgi:hypothetical protein
MRARMILLDTVTAAELALAPRLLLTLTFLVAGLAKIGTPRRSVQMLRDFGVPSVLQGLGLLLAPAELLVAVGLVFATTSGYAAWTATGLLVLFILAIAVNLWRGRTPECNCFGQIRPAPIGWTTIARDGALLACAVWLVISASARSSNLWSSLALLTQMQRRIVTVAAAALLFALLTDTRRRTPATANDAWDAWWGHDDSEPEPATAARPSTVRHTTAATASASTRVEASDEAPHTGHQLSGLGLDVGTPIPDVFVADFDGQRYPIASLLTPGVSVAFIFSTPNCPACQTLMSSLPELAAVSAPDLHVVLVSGGTREQNLEKVRAPGAVRLLRQDHYEVSEAFNCTTTPAAVIVSPEGRVESTLAQGPLEIRKLITATSARIRAGRGATITS